MLCLPLNKVHSAPERFDLGECFDLRIAQLVYMTIEAMDQSGGYEISCCVV
jgi:hypothetical protein